MNADEVIELRKRWDRFNFASFLPEATVLATIDWLAYVQAMAALIDRQQETVELPSEADVSWAWPEGVTIVMDEPIKINHTIISKQNHPGARSEDVPPHVEVQSCAGMVFGIGQTFPGRLPGSDRIIEPGVYTIPVLWIGTDPSDIITGAWSPGGISKVMNDAGLMSESTCFMLAVIEALGHRLTRESEMRVRHRGERRRIQRELPSLRMLSLGSGASVSLGDGSGHVAWSHRWIVRGHWRLQACGPRQTERKRRWIDPYVKGPEDKPFDERRTLWRTK
jgi:hypothetical protein